MIPQTDPRAGYLRRKDEIDAAVGAVLARGQYILGPEVQAFEEEFAAWTGSRHAIAVANGTDALVIGLLALGVRPEDAVVTVSHTAVATVAAIEMMGAVPILVDTDAFYGMDPGGLALALELCRASGRRVGAVVPVHLLGQACDLPTLRLLAQEAGAPLLEDCSQAHGASLGSRMVGRFGDLAAYSLYPTKNLGAFGDAGIVTTDDDTLADGARAARQYGWRERFISSSAGRNSRLDELQAAILRIKLRTLSADNDRRREIASAYDRGLADLAVVRPRRRDEAGHVFHQYVIRTEHRDRLKALLAEHGVGTGIHYAVPVHRQPAYEGRVALAGDVLPHTDASATEILSLPMYPELSDEAVGRVIDAVKAALGRARWQA